MFTPEAYNLFTNNCNNFSNELATFLTGRPIPVGKFALVAARQGQSQLAQGCVLPSPCVQRVLLTCGCNVWTGVHRSTSPICLRRCCQRPWARCWRQCCQVCKACPIHMEQLWMLLLGSVENCAAYATLSKSIARFCNAHQCRGSAMHGRWWFWGSEIFYPWLGRNGVAAGQCAGRGCPPTARLPHPRLFAPPAPATAARAVCADSLR